MNQAPNQPYDVDGSTSDPNEGVTSTTTPRVSNSDDSAAIGRFLEETGLLSSGEPTMSLAEMCAFFLRSSYLLDEKTPVLSFF